MVRADLQLRNLTEQKGCGMISYILLAAVLMVLLKIHRNIIEKILKLERNKARKSHSNTRGWTYLKNRRSCSLKVQWKKDYQSRLVFLLMAA